MFVQISELHDFSANETTLEIGMDDTSTTGSLGSLTESPALDLVLSSSEVMTKLKGTVANVDDSVDHGGLAELSSSGISGSSIGRTSSSENFGLVLSRERNHGATTVSGDPSLDLGKPLVLGADVVVAANVDEVDDGLGAHEEMLVEHFDVLAGPLSVTDGLLLQKHGLALVKGLFLLLVGLLVHASNDSVKFGDSFLEGLEILLKELVCDDVQISDRVKITFGMHDFLVVESTHDMVDAVNSLDVGQESVSETLTLAGAGHKTRNIEDGDTGGNLGTGVVHVAKAFESLVRDKDLSLSWLDGTERIVLSGDTQVGQDVESG